MGIERGSFGVLALSMSTMFAMQLYYLMPSVIVLYLVARWLCKVDAQYVAVLARYLYEEHVFDATPRPSDFQSRPKGWGNGLPR